MPALIIAVILLLGGCAYSEEPVDTTDVVVSPAAVTEASTECEERMLAEQYMEDMHEEMREKGLEDSSEFKAFEESFWDSFEENHKWCKTCNPTKEEE